jgi:hypothetical protein
MMKCQICGEEILPRQDDILAAVATMEDQNGNPLWTHSDGCPIWSPAFDGDAWVESNRFNSNFNSPDDPVRARRLAGRRY